VFFVSPGVGLAWETLDGSRAICISNEFQVASSKDIQTSCDDFCEVEKAAHDRLDVSLRLQAVFA
jgi:hypothetical protein